MSISLALALIALPTVAIIAWREHARVLASRRGLLDQCRSLLSDAVIHHGGDGFPILEGRHCGHMLRIELVPDTMTIRRLPQLWLKLTRLEARPRFPEFSVLVRPSGTEFYSLTSAHGFILEPPPGLASEVIARGSERASQRTLDGAQSVLRRVFSDGRMKEVGVTAKGVRMVWQAAEGSRGEHLLFRQCRFDDAAVDPGDFLRVLDQLNALSVSLNKTREVQAA